MSTRHCLLLLCLMLALLGCGQKGPLYLPDTPPQASANDEDRED